MFPLPLSPSPRLVAELVGLTACVILATDLVYSQRTVTETQTRLDSVTHSLELSKQELVSSQRDAKTSSDTDAKTTTVTLIKPDGTKQVTQVVEKETKHTTEVERIHTAETLTQTVQTDTHTVQTTTTKTEAPAATSASLSRYALEALWDPTRWATQGISAWPLTVVAGARLGNLPVWAEAGWNFDTHNALLGIRVEF